ncbi:hypothetical protein KCP75_08815 [Salmonella enterica subsp. enterica]|nr:hypothetical protein KCP75_08815 [Salmonella enterica subsp. enterica]
MNDKCPRFYRQKPISWSRLRSKTVVVPGVRAQARSGLQRFLVMDHRPPSLDAHIMRLFWATAGALAPMERPTSIGPLITRSHHRSRIPRNAVKLHSFTNSSIAAALNSLRKRHYFGGH